MSILSSIANSLKNANDTAISAANIFDDFFTMVGDFNGTTISQVGYDLSSIIEDINGSPLANK